MKKEVEWFDNLSEMRQSLKGQSQAKSEYEPIKINKKPSDPKNRVISDVNDENSGKTKSEEDQVKDVKEEKDEKEVKKKEPKASDGKKKNSTKKEEKSDE